MNLEIQFYLSAKSMAIVPNSSKETLKYRVSPLPLVNSVLFIYKIFNTVLVDKIDIIH